MPDTIPVLPRDLVGYPNWKGCINEALFPVRLCLAGDCRRCCPDWSKSGADDLPPLPATVANGAKLVSVYSDDRSFEGPVWDTGTKKLYFTAFGTDNTQILRLDVPGKVTVWLDKTEGVNGMFLANSGRLLAAQRTDTAC